MRYTRSVGSRKGLEGVIIILQSGWCLLCLGIYNHVVVYIAIAVVLLRWPRGK